MRKALTWRPHRQTVSSTQPSWIDQNGPGNSVTLQLCSCTAWRIEGSSRWKGSHFRRRQQIAAVAR